MAKRNLTSEPMTAGEALLEHLETSVPSSQRERSHNITGLPNKYNNVRLSGDSYVNGKVCRTVGELKAAYLREYGP